MKLEKQNKKLIRVVEELLEFSDACLTELYDLGSGYVEDNERVLLHLEKKFTKIKAQNKQNKKDQK